MLRYSEHFPGAGEEMLQAARETGVEGLMAKRATSRYESRRSSEWLKLKIVERQEFVICGFTAGERDHFGALVLGVYDDGRLMWVGNVGTGFDQKTHGHAAAEARSAGSDAFTVSGLAQSGQGSYLGETGVGGGSEVRQLDQ